VAAPASTAYYGPRFDYDPVTLAPKGLLIEEQRTNLLLRSEEFDNASWTKLNTTITANSSVSPDGTVDADTLVETTATGVHRISQSFTPSATGSFTSSIVGKASTRNWLAIQNDFGSNNTTQLFNLSTGALGTQSGAGGTATIRSLGNGWYRCTLTTTTSTTNAGACNIYVSSGDNINSYAGDGTSGLFIYGAQLEVGAFATSYIPTVASQVTRAVDSASMIGNNFARWYNQTEGTIYAQGIAAAGVDPVFNTQGIVAVSDGTSNNRLRIVRASSQTTQWTSVSGGVITYNTTVGSWPNLAASKVASAYKTNDFSSYQDGGVRITVTSGLPPSGVNLLQIGDQPAGVRQWGGTISRIAYYNRRLANTELTALTN
jgi:hypothetical protein